MSVCACVSVCVLYASVYVSVVFASACDYVICESVCVCLSERLFL